MIGSVARLGSSALYATAEQIEVGASVHLALDQRKLVNLALRLTAAPRHREGHPDRRLAKSCTEPESEPLVGGGQSRSCHRQLRPPKNNPRPVNATVQRDDKAPFARIDREAVEFGLADPLATAGRVLN
jgi:hypothetical protein